MSAETLADLIRFTRRLCPECGGRLFVETQLPARTHVVRCSEGHEVNPS